MKRNLIKKSKNRRNTSADKNQTCKSKSVKKMKLGQTKSANDYNQDDYQALFEKCKHVMKGWTKTKLESFLEENKEMSEKIEVSQQYMMNFEKNSKGKFDDEMKSLNKILEETGNNMTMKDKRKNRQMKMEVMKAKEKTKKEVEKLKNKIKRQIRTTKELRKLGETVKKAFNVVEIMLGMHVEE